MSTFVSSLPKTGSKTKFKNSEKSGLSFELPKVTGSFTFETSGFKPTVKNPEVQFFYFVVNGSQYGVSAKNVDESIFKTTKDEIVWNGLPVEIVGNKIVPAKTK